jgi:uncharacterized membrane protein (UPF0127 family)
MDVKIRNLTNNAMLCERASLADSFYKRAKGLMFRKEWDGLDGLLLSPCGSIHTCCMRMEIDVCFLDCEQRVLKALASLRPWRSAHGGRESHTTLELPAGTLERTGTRAGDRLDVDRREKKHPPDGSVEG